MAANQNPIFTLTPNIGGFTSADGNGGTAGPLKTANTAGDGTGTVLTVFTAGTNGSFLQRLRVKATTGGNNIASVLRVWINNGSTNATLGNNILVDEITLPATTGIANASTAAVELPLNFAIPNGYKVNVALGTTVATGYFVSVIAADY